VCSSLICFFLIFSIGLLLLFLYLFVCICLLFRFYPSRAEQFLLQCMGASTIAPVSVRDHLPVLYEMPASCTAARPVLVEEEVWEVHTPQEGNAAAGGSGGSCGSEGGGTSGTGETDKESCLSARWVGDGRGTFTAAGSAAGPSGAVVASQPPEMGQNVSHQDAYLRALDEQLYRNNLRRRIGVKERSVPLVQFDIYGLQEVLTVSSSVGAATSSAGAKAARPVSGQPVAIPSGVSPITYFQMLNQTAPVLTPSSASRHTTSAPIDVYAVIALHPAGGAGTIQGSSTGAGVGAGVGGGAGSMSAGIGGGGGSGFASSAKIRSSSKSPGPSSGKRNAPLSSKNCINGSVITSMHKAEPRRTPLEPSVPGSSCVHGKIAPKPQLTSTELKNAQLLETIASSIEFTWRDQALFRFGLPEGLASVFPPPTAESAVAPLAVGGGGGGGSGNSGSGYQEGYFPRTNVRDDSPLLQAWHFATTPPTVLFAPPLPTTATTLTTAAAAAATTPTSRSYPAYPTEANSYANANSNRPLSSINSGGTGTPKRGLPGPTGNNTTGNNTPRRLQQPPTGQRGTSNTNIGNSSSNNNSTNSRGNYSMEYAALAQLRELQVRQEQLVLLALSAPVSPHWYSDIPSCISMAVYEHTFFSDSLLGELRLDLSPLTVHR
jgi:hypothetical protein